MPETLLQNESGRLWRLIAVIVAMTLLMLSLLLFSSKERQHISNVHTAALVATEEAINDLTLMHLMVEELLSGDTSVNPASVGRQFDSALAHLDRVVDLVRVEHLFRHHPLSLLNGRIVEINDKINRLRKLTEQRLANPALSRNSPAEDRDFDALAGGLMADLEALDAILDDERQGHVDFSGLLQAAVMALILLIGLVTVWLVIIHDRRRQQDFVSVLEARDALHQRDAMLGAIFAASPDMMLIVDASLSTIEANDRAVETLGYDQSDLLGSGVGRLADHDDGQSRLLQSLTSALRGEAADFECHLLRKDGSVLPVEVRMRPLPDREGGVSKVLLIMRDLSTLHKLQASLVAEEKRYHSIFERSPAALWEDDFSVIKQELDRLQAEGVGDLQGYFAENTAEFKRLLGSLVVRAVNKAALDLHGATSVEQLLQGVEKTFTPVSRSGFVSNLVELASGKRECRLETQVKTLAGDLRDVILSLSIMPGSETTWERVLVTMVDVTVLKNAQRELAEAQRVASLGSWVLDIRTNDLRWSDEIFRIFEIDPDRFEASYDAFLELVHPEDRAKLDEEYNRSLQTRQPYDLVHRIVMADGRTKYLHERCETIFDEGGAPVRSLGTVQDVTVQMLAEQEQLDQQRKMEHVQRLESLGVLAGGIAHDFNNLLTAIMGNATLAREHVPEAGQAADYLDRIESTSKRAADLCQQMLAYSGKGRFVIRPVNLSDLVEEMMHLLQVSISKGIVLRLDLNRPLPAVEADVAQMQQVVMNLVTNAAEAIGERSGVITVATGVTLVDEHYLAGAVGSEKLPLGHYAYVEVSDTGIGMDEATKQRIFEPFFTTKFTGRGLGMAAVLGIVRGHKGAIRIYSEPGKGTTFKVLFPCQESAAEAGLPSEEASSRKWRSEATVLVVDDEESIREVAAMALERIGMRVMKAADGVEAVEIFKTHHAEIDAVLLDMTMPRMGGEETFVQLRRIDPKVKVVLSSGYNEQDATNRFAGKKLAGFIKKPYTPTLLFEKLREVLESPEGAA